MEDFTLFGLDSATLFEYAIQAVTVLILFVVLLIVASWVKRVVLRGLTKANFDITLSKFFANMARYAVLVMGVLGILEKFGFESTSFAAIIGAAGLAIGLAFQGTLSNFAAGVMLLTFRPFKVGDVVTVSSVTAKVVEIELFYVNLDTPDNRRITIPNSSIFGSTITNITYHPTRRVDVVVGTEYGADLAQTRAILERVAANVEGGLKEPAPAIVLTGLGDSSINWSVRAWSNTSDYWAVFERLNRDVKNALDEAGIGIPFPQMDVHLDGKLGD